MKKFPFCHNVCADNVSQCGTCHADLSGIRNITITSKRVIIAFLNLLWVAYYILMVMFIGWNPPPYSTLVMIAVAIISVYTIWLSFKKQSILVVFVPILSYLAYISLMASLGLYGL